MSSKYWYYDAGPDGKVWKVYTDRTRESLLSHLSENYSLVAQGFSRYLHTININIYQHSPKDIQGPAWFVTVGKEDFHLISADDSVVLLAILQKLGFSDAKTTGAKFGWSD